jgi:hypothetical protein
MKIAKRQQIWIPPSKRVEYFMSLHIDKDGVHRGINEMQSIAIASRTVKGCDKIIRLIPKHCQKCSAIVERPPATHGRHNDYPKPNKVWVIDLTELTPPIYDNKGKAYLVNIVDFGSKFTWSKLVFDK